MFLQNLRFCVKKSTPVSKIHLKICCSEYLYRAHFGPRSSMAPKKAPQRQRYEPTAEGNLQYSTLHDEIFGTGWEHTVYTKAMLLHVERGLRNLWRNPNGTYKRRITRPPAGKFELFFRRHFKAVTGFEVTRAQEFQAEVRKNNGYLQARKKKGPDPIILEEQFHDLKEWAENEAKKAARAGYLTIPRLMEKFKKDYIEDGQQGPIAPGEGGIEPVMKMPSRDVFRGAMLRMNFKYGARKIKRLEARVSPQILQQLDEFLQWTVENHEYRPSKYKPGKMVYDYRAGINAGSGDVSYMESTESQIDSWHNANTRFKNFMKKNSRLAMAHSIFNRDNFKTNGDWIVPPAYWCTQWKKAREDFKYWGKTNAENLEKVFADSLYGLSLKSKPEESNILFLDNASAHKRIRDELRGNIDEVLKWLDSAVEINEEVTNLAHALHQSAAEKGMELQKPELLKSLRKAGVRTFELEKIAHSYNGAQIKYLPPYYSELNPIELLWAEVKRVYRSETNPDDDWETRMKQAWDSITPQFIESCFDRAIRWALKTHKERQAKKAAAAPAPEDIPAGAYDEPYADDDEAGEDEDDAADIEALDEILDEEAIDDMWDILDDL